MSMGSERSRTLDEASARLVPFDREFRGKPATRGSFGGPESSGKHYPPKTVIGLAVRHISGGLLTPEHFSGEAPGQSNFVLRGLGSTVEMKGEAVAEPAEIKEWTAEEASLIVVDYFVLRVGPTTPEQSGDWLLRVRKRPLGGRDGSTVQIQPGALAGPIQLITSR
jgi:hypothetical protein